MLKLTVKTPESPRSGDIVTNKRLVKGISLLCLLKFSRKKMVKNAQIQIINK